MITRLVTANKSRVSIRDTKLLARAGGMVDPVKFSSHLFHHHAKLGYCFSYHLRTYRRSQKISETLGTAAYDGGVPPPPKQNTHIPTCYHAKFGPSRPNVTSTRTRRSYGNGANKVTQGHWE